MEEVVKEGLHLAWRGRVFGVASSYSRRTTAGPGIVGNMILDIEKQPA